MDFATTEEQRQIVDTTRAFVEKELFPHEAEVERTGKLDHGLRDAIKAKITDGPFEPLKPSTIAARKSKRKSRSNADIKPLIDTGALRNSISYVIRDEGK